MDREIRFVVGMGGRLGGEDDGDGRTGVEQVTARPRELEA
jgi:hypothetical protein